MKAEYLQTTGQDWVNHISHELEGNGTIHLAAVLGADPDTDSLRQALLDSIELQPVLGCLFDEGQDPPVWVPRRDVSSCFSVDRADRWQQGFDAFLREPPSQPLAVRQITCPRESALCLKLDHAATDAAGAKRYLALLSRLYNARLTKEKPPRSNPRDRSDGQVFAACGVRDLRMPPPKGNRVAGPIVTFRWRNMREVAARYAWVSVPLADVQAVSGCTVNDLLLAACARALTRGMDGDRQVVLNVTVDLRRYLAEDDAPIACNLSGMEAVYLDVSRGESFAETAGKSLRATASLKAERPGLNSALSMAYLRLMPFGKAKELLLDASRKAKAAGAAAPIVSNLGWLCKGALRFGDIPVTAMIPLLPAMHAPAIMLGAGSYGTAMILSAGFYEGARQESDVVRLLENVKAEMTGTQGSSSSARASPG